MIKVKFFGLLRLDYGVKSTELEAASFKELLSRLEENTGIEQKTLRSCVILLNGKPMKIFNKLHDGDEVVFLPPACGG